MIGRRILVLYVVSFALALVTLGVCAITKMIP